MKKSMILGAAALATVAFAPVQSDAGEVKMGGYYMFSMVNADDTLTTDAASVDDRNAWYHRLQLNMDFIASPKSHAHMVTRVIDTTTVTGSNATDINGASDWDIRQLWLETEMWGVGLKVGNMPIALNDNILVNHDTTSFGTIMLSKTFGDVTLVAADVRVAENSAVGASGVATTATAAGGADNDDVDLYVLSLIGKSGKVDYQLTGAYLDVQPDAADVLGLSAADANGNTQDANDYWLAATVGTQLGNVDVTGTLIYEAGMDNATPGSQLEQGDLLAALRLNGKAGFGGWNAYAFYAGEDYSAIPTINNFAGWSPTWDQGGVGGRDLLDTWGMTGTAGNNTAAQATGAGNGITTSMTENMWGIGVGLKVNAGAWVVAPSIDYASMVENSINGVTANSESAWGASVSASTKIQEATTLKLDAGYVDPNDDTAATAGNTDSVDAMHFLRASVKMDF